MKKISNYWLELWRSRSDLLCEEAERITPGQVRFPPRKWGRAPMPQSNWASQRIWQSWWRRLKLSRYMKINDTSSQECSNRFRAMRLINSRAWMTLDNLGFEKTQDSGWNLTVDWRSWVGILDLPFTSNLFSYIMTLFPRLQNVDISIHLMSFLW